MKASEST